MVVFLSHLVWGFRESRWPLRFCMLKLPSFSPNMLLNNFSNSLWMLYTLIRMEVEPFLKTSLKETKSCMKSPYPKGVSGTLDRRPRAR